jgi:hypothetical protein
MAELSDSIQDDIRAAEPGWVSTCCRCMICEKTWCAVWPIDLDRFDLDDTDAVHAAFDEQIPDLECPRCGQQGSTEEIRPDELNPNS